MRQKSGFKKALVLATSIAMLMGCAACGKSSMDIIEEQMAAMESGGDSSEGNDTVSNSYEILEEMMKSTPTPTLKPVKKETAVGKMENGVYTNSYLGLQCTFDSDWVFYSAAELQEITGAAMELLEESSVAEYLEDMEYFMDMKAENVDDLTTVNVTYTKMSKQDRERYAELTEKEIVERTLASIDAVADSYAQAGMTIKSKEARTIYFLGESRTAQYMYSDYMGTPYYTLQIYDYHTGDYATVVTLASYGQDKTMELLNLFTKYE